MTHIYEPVYYSLLLRAKRMIDPIGTVWKLVQVLTETGENFAPRFLGTGARRREPLVIDGPQAIARILADPRVGFGSAKELGVSFELTPVNPRIRTYFTVGRTDPGLYNSFRIAFPSKVPITDVISIEKLYDLFCRSVLAFSPFWGCIQNAVNVDRFQGTLDPSRRYSTAELEADFPIVKVDESKVPRLIHWYNYFGPEFVRQLGGLEKLLAGPVWLAEEIEDLGGVTWVLQREPFDDDNPKHLERQQDAMEYLKLFDIHKQYMLG